MASHRSTRSPALSLKARAIALLAQREHSVAELRRKLLRLAQLRDLQAWTDAQPLGAEPAWPGLGHPGSDAQQAGAGRTAPANETCPQQGGARAPAVSPRSERPGIGSFDLDEDWDEGEFDAFMDDWAAEQAAPASDAAAPSCPQSSGALASGEASASAAAMAGPGRLPRRGADVAEAGIERRARRKSAQPRGSVPSAEALDAVMQDERQQSRADEVEQLLQWLQERGYLSEARLVESRINARAARYGNLRIRQELRQLGVAPDEAQQARLKDSELDRAREVWRRKFGGEAPVDAASRARQMRFLAARGFSSEVVRQVLRGDDD